MQKLQLRRYLLQQISKTMQKETMSRAQWLFLKKRDMSSSVLGQAQIYGMSEDIMA